MNIASQIKWLEDLREIGRYDPDDPEDSESLEEILNTLRKLNKTTLLWHHGVPAKRGVYPVKCDGPNPNKGFRHWDGTRWGAWSRTHRGAAQLAADPTIRKAQIIRPVLYATRGK